MSRDIRDTSVETYVVKSDTLSSATDNASRPGRTQRPCASAAAAAAQQESGGVTGTARDVGGAVGGAAEGAAKGIGDAVRGIFGR